MQHPVRADPDVGLERCGGRQDPGDLQAIREQAARYDHGENGDQGNVVPRISVTSKYCCPVTQYIVPGSYGIPLILQVLTESFNCAGFSSGSYYLILIIFINKLIVMRSSNIFYGSPPLDPHP